MYSLDENPLVAGVRCGTPRHADMTVLVSDVLAAERWVPGAILVGHSDRWQCVNKRGHVGPIVRKIIALESVEVEGFYVNGSSVDFAVFVDHSRPHPAIVRLTTVAVAPKHCFGVMSVSYSRKILAIPDTQTTTSRPTSWGGRVLGGCRNFKGVLPAPDRPFLAVASRLTRRAARGALPGAATRARAVGPPPNFAPRLKTSLGLPWWVRI